MLTLYSFERTEYYRRSLLIIVIIFLGIVLIMSAVTLNRNNSAVKFTYIFFMYLFCHFR